MGWKLLIFLLLPLFQCRSILFSLKSISQIDGPPYERLSEALQQRCRENADLCSVRLLGKTPQGRQLLVFELGYVRAKPSFPAVFLTQTIHGNEYLGIVDAILLHWLHYPKRPSLENYLKKGGVVYLLPFANPDGYEQIRRSNTNGVDLNRAFLPDGTTAVEAQYIVSFLEGAAQEGASFQLSMDYHCCDGSVLWPEINLKEPDNILAYRGVARRMASLIGESYRAGRVDTVLGYRPTHTLQAYMHNRHRALAFIFEGRQYFERENLPRHLLLWDYVFETLARGQEP